MVSSYGNRSIAANGLVMLDHSSSSQGNNMWRIGIHRNCQRIDSFGFPGTTGGVVAYDSQMENSRPRVNNLPSRTTSSRQTEQPLKSHYSQNHFFHPQYHLQLQLIGFTSQQPEKGNKKVLASDSSMAAIPDDQLYIWDSGDVGV